MIQRMLASALFAGCAAGLLAALLHFAFVQEKILLGEDYESGAAMHFAGVMAEGMDHGHDHAATAAPADTGAAPGAATGDAPEAATGDHSHHHGAPEDGEAGPFKRNALTVMFHVLLYCSYALVMVAGFALAERAGHRVTSREGLVWGVAGFVALQLAPAMGLAPELPGTAGADLTARQVWWAGTAVTTAAGLALLGYGRGLAAAGLGAMLIALPHILGAPELDHFSGVAPPEVAAAFAARALGLGLAAWSLLGWLAGRLWGGQAA